LLLYKGYKFVTVDRLWQQANIQVKAN
jgi:hypothetical protein